jgi:broad specificity phosphatase PhoE
MSDCVWLLRHGATEWSEDDRHTGREDVPLSDVGRDQARLAGRLLSARRVAHVLVSPQTRARETCELAGFADRAKSREELVEWDYGEYEGLTDEQTQQRHPGWELFRDWCPGGESPEQVSARVDRLLKAVRSWEGSCLLVAHGKLLRALGARWVQHDVALGSVLAMDPAAISLLEREQSGPLLRL